MTIKVKGYFHGRSSKIRTYDLSLPKRAHYQAVLYSDKNMAPKVGLEPTTLSLTVKCTTIVLLRNKSGLSLQRSHSDITVQGYVL